MHLGTYYRTVRPMHWSQLLWRIRYMLERRRSPGSRVVARRRWTECRPPLLRDDFPTLPLLHRPEPIPWRAEGESAASPSSLHVPPDWRLGPVAVDRLGAITLHYHGWLHELAEAARGVGPGVDEAAAVFRQGVADWLVRCAVDAPGARHLAWNSYAIATRLTWWIRCYRLLDRERWCGWGAFEHDFLGSLWEQAAHLRDHLEWDLRANHLMRDAVGLVWAGRFFAEERARGWLRTGTRLAVEQAVEQVLPDGGHFERSPMYHLHVMEDLLSLALLIEDAGARQTLQDTWRRMAETLRWLRHPDGDLALFNDGGLQGTDRVARMLELGARLGAEPGADLPQGGRHFADTGLAVWHGDPWSVFFDVGPVGPVCQPGHAHADTLSVECSFRGRRLFVDPGTYAYDLDERRRYDRSTAAHNTVVLDGHDSSEVWHIFRVGRRADPRAVEVDFSAGGLRATAAHTGYDHLPGRPRPTRFLEIGCDGKLTLTDRVEGHGRHRVEGGFLLGPGWIAEDDAGGWVLRNEAARVRLHLRAPEGTRLFQESRPYHPEYGREIEQTRLRWHWYGELPLEVVTVALPD
jgi:hypothetical protein